MWPAMCGVWWWVHSYTVHWSDYKQFGVTAYSQNLVTSLRIEDSYAIKHQKSYNLYNMISTHANCGHCMSKHI